MTFKPDADVAVLQFRDIKEMYFPRILLSTYVNTWIRID